MGYRAEIDGLRAVAVLVVVLFHAGYAPFSGGFVGVDVFFVISGYLIAGILLRELRNGQLSFLKFWERRIRRLLPALLFMLVVTSLLAYSFLSFPNDRANFGESVVATSLLLANVYFMTNSGYFDAPVETMPLLHTWSLSVEEQFYLLFPLLLVLCYRVSRKCAILTLTGLALGSLVVNLAWTYGVAGQQFNLPLWPDVWRSATYADAAFYLLFTRAWELLVGCLIALVSISIKGRSLAEFMSVIGLGMILYAVLTLTGESSFPGLNALWPVMGTALIIISTQHHVTFVAQILKFPVLVGLGLISYSLYLWHWPLLVFEKILFQQTLIPFAILLAVGVSVFSYYAIEQPFRKKQLLPHWQQVYLFGVAMFLITLSVGYGLRSIQPDIELSPFKNAVLAATESETRSKAVCRAGSVTTTTGSFEVCLVGAETDQSPDFLVWGDSHTNAHIQTFDKLGKEFERTGVVFSAGGCTPVFNVFRWPTNEECQTTKWQVKQIIDQSDFIDVFLFSRWSVNVQGRVNGSLNTLIFDEVDQPRTVNNAATVLERNLALTIDKLSSYPDTHIYLFKQVPLQPSFEPRAVFYSEELPHHLTTVDEHIAYHRVVNDILDQMAVDSQVAVINPVPSLCADGVCQLTKSTQSQILYRDGDHINTAGAQLFYSQFRDSFARRSQ